MNFIDHMQQISPLAPGAAAELENITREISFRKGELILSEGEVCNEMYFLKSGCLRGSYNIDGKDVTCWIALDGSFAASFASLITSAPSHESVTAIEDTTAFALSFTKLSALFGKHHQIETLGRLISQKYYLQLEARTYALQFLSAADRYEFLLKNKPELIRRVPLGHLASYIGVSPETLSRIRAR